MALINVQKIMLRNTADSYKHMWVSNSYFGSFELNPCSYLKQSIHFYTCPYGDIKVDELYNFIITAARGNSKNDGLVVCTNPNLDIYFFVSDGSVCKGRITSVNITFSSNNSPGTIHLEFYMYHDMSPMRPSGVGKDAHMDNTNIPYEIREALRMNNYMTLADTFEVLYGVGKDVHMDITHHDDAMEMAMKRTVVPGSRYVAPAVWHLMPGIDRIIFNNPATIVYWTDGTKTVVKAHDEEFSEEHGLAMAFARKVLETAYGNKHPRAGFKRLVREAKHC